MDRKYQDWITLFADQYRRYPLKKFVLRHDVDFDIATAFSMAEYEHIINLKAIYFVDVHNPNYGMDQILELYDTFKVPIGLHIDVAYEQSDIQGCVEQVRQDLALLKDNGIEPHSVAGHFRNSRIDPVPVMNNVDVEREVDRLADAGDGTCLCRFHRKHFVQQERDVYKLTDGGKMIALSPLDWIESLNPQAECYMISHPIYLDGMEYTGRFFGHGYGDDDEAVARAHDYVKHRLTPYLQSPIGHLPWLLYARKWIGDFAVENHRKMVKVADWGMGFGLLGGYLMRHHNIKYQGWEIRREFRDVGMDFFDSMGFAPRLYVDDYFAGRHGLREDFSLFLAAEDGEDIDYERIANIGNGEETRNVIITSLVRQYYDDAISRGKMDYTYMPTEDVERHFFENGFRLNQKVNCDGKRWLYWFENTRP
jgi:hypothetical protein